MKKINDIRLKRREQMIKDLQQENNELKKQLINEKVLKDKEIEVDALMYQLKELQTKLCNEIREFERAKDEYIVEKREFAKLNVEYKRKMERFLKQINYKGEDANDNTDK